MKTKNNPLKAAIILAIALVLVLPSTALAFEKNNQNVKKIGFSPIIKDTGWVQQASGFWETNRGINYIHAVDENIIWASGYDGSGSQQPVQEFTKTVNGGEYWEADTIPSAPSDGDLAMIFALDENTAWVPIHSGNPQGIWKTSDGGDNWVRQASANFSGNGAFPNIVHFWNENDGWCQGDPVDGYYEMYTTTDGGDNWIRVPQENIPDPAGAGEYGVVGYYDVIGDTIWWGTQWNSGNGRVFKSTDKGYNWDVYDTPFTSGCYIDVRMKDELNGLAMDKRQGGSKLAETSDGGETWTLVTPSGFFYDYDISYVPGTDNMWICTGAAEGDAGAAYSLDGGHNWILFDDVLGVQLLDCDFIEGGIGWAGSFSQDEYTGGVWKYTPSTEPDLACSGDFNWADVAPGETVVGNFTIQNIGGPTTLLDWEIITEPEWGTWTFDPNSGTDVAPGDTITVNVEVVAPEDPEAEFDGEVVIVNVEDTNDTCTIDVSLATPVSQSYPILEFIAQRFPILAKILTLIFL